MAELWAIALVVFTTLIGSGMPILFKKATLRFRKGQFRSIKGIMQVMFNPYLIGGVSLSIIATILFIPALKGGELSALYPIVSVQYVWVSLLSVKFLKEKMDLLQVIGIVLIITGIIAINIG